MKIALLADIHANLEAFQAVLDDIKKQAIDEILCAGDLINYSANPNETLELVKQNEIVSCLGNHDANAISPVELTQFPPEAQKSLLWTSKQLTNSSKEMLSKLPKTINLNLDGRNIFLVHGSPKNFLWDYVFPNTSENILEDFLNQVKTDILVLGHTHIPMIRRIKGKLVINPGSVGQPRDFRPEASYCILETLNLRASIIKVPYDINKAALKIISAQLPRYFADRLFTGR